MWGAIQEIQRTASLGVSQVSAKSIVVWAAACVGAVHLIGCANLRLALIVTCTRAMLQREEFDTSF